MSEMTGEDRPGIELPSLEELRVDVLGPGRFESPLRELQRLLVEDEDRVPITSSTVELHEYLEKDGGLPSFEGAGPRESLFFDPEETRCGIVTCGGLCPGINNVIRSIVLALSHGYGVDEILGFRWGYAGVAGVEEKGPPISLEPSVVEPIHRLGGSFLGSSRGHQDLGDMVDNLVRHEVDVLFAIGGDGTLRGARALSREIRSRGLEIGIVCVPKTIDNDILWIERSFGFATAVEEARQAILGAHAEARGAWNGIGLVKLMGRHSGYITVHASLANSDVNFCLIPEVPFTLDGEGGLLDVLEERLLDRHHAVIAVAEGAGQELLREDEEVSRDVSGNVELEDIGRHLERRIEEHFSAQGIEHTIKYIDPSYIVRSMPANSMDSQYCLMLGQHAVHAGMAGRTNMVVGFWNRRFTHVPIPVAVGATKKLDRRGPTWQRVLESTGQPADMVGR